MLQEDLAYREHEVRVRILHCLFFAAKLDFNALILLISKEPNQISTGPDHVVLEKLINKAAISWLCFAFNHNPSKQFLNVLLLFLVSGVKLDENGLI